MIFVIPSLIVTLLLNPHSTLATPTSSVVTNPLAMTMTQALAIPTNANATQGRVTVLANRGPTPLIEDRQELRYNAFFQTNRTAPVAFVIPGTGGLSSSAGAMFLAEKLFRQGYHAITVDNPFSWTFAISGSRSALPGYAPHDAQDLYRALQKVREKVVKENGLAPRSYNLIGYSLGALQSVFLKKLDDSVQAFRFNKTYLINPPLDLVYSMTVLDSYFDRGMRLSEGRRSYVMGRIYAIGEKYLMGEKKIEFTDSGFVESVFRQLAIKNEDMVFLIGQTFRESLRDVIFASQQVQDRGVLKSRVSKGYRNARMTEALSFSFQRYAKTFILPSLKTRGGGSLEELNQKSSLYQFGDYIANQPGIFVIHSRDDFILKSGDIEWIQAKFGSRAIILPYGGHCGLINFPQFNDSLKTIFSLVR